MSFEIGLAGLTAATRRLDAAALDILRAASPTVDQAPARPDGDAAAQPDATTPANPVAEQPVDLPTAMVEQIRASLAFMANVQTIRVANENMQTLLDLGD